MKLRILNNSIRLRLSQGEVQTLHQEGVVRCTTRFGTDAESILAYSLQGSDTIQNPTAAFIDREVLIKLPKDIVQAWATSDLVSIRAEQEVDGEVLRILVEKDFKCLTERPGEDEGDLFPNPLEKHS